MRKRHLALVLLAVAPAAAVVVEPTAGGARGSLTVNGRVTPLQYAYVRATDDTLIVYLSDSPLTTRHLTKSGVTEGLVEQDKLHMLVLSITKPGGRVRLLSIDHSDLKEQRLLTTNVGAFRAQTLKDDRVEGTVSTQGPVTEPEGTFEYDVTFRAVPAPWEANDALDWVLHPVPPSWRDAFSRYALPVGLGVAFSSPLWFGMLWVWVIVPGRNKRFLRRLETRGYAAIRKDDGELAAALAQLMPLTRFGRMRTGVADEAPTPTQAVVRRSGGTTRFVARVWRMQAEKRGARNTNTMYSFMIILESRALPLVTDTYVVDKGAVSDAWTEVLGVREVTEGLEARFSERYSTCSTEAGASNLPHGLQVALGGLPNRYGVPPFALRETCLRVGAAGWGMCNSAMTDPKEMEHFLETADAISRALDEAA